MCADRLVNNNMLFVIPSWSELLGYPTLSKYVNHFVSKIHSDLVIFLAGIESTIPIQRGSEKRWLHYLFGLGYYYSKFELQSGRYIIDNRQLTGLILSDFVYDFLATLRNITLENDRDVIIGDRLIKIPINLSNKSNTEISFIKGALMRNVFIPYKDIFLELMRTIQNRESYQSENEHMLLSTNWESFNKILISNKMNESLKKSYLNPTAGIYNITLGADEYLNGMFSTSERQKIESNLSYLKNIYSTLEYDPMYLFSIIDNASKYFFDQQTNIYMEKNQKAVKSKESIFLSAESRMKSFFYWPQEFKRNTKEELESFAIFKELESYPPVVPDSQSSEELSPKRSNFDTEKDYKREKFEIRTMKHEDVDYKSLPIPPRGDIEKILNYLKNIIERDFEMRLIGIAFEFARNNLREIILQSKFMWEMGKYANLYQKIEPHLGLSQKEKTELLESIDNWIEDARINKKKYIIKK